MYIRTAWVKLQTRRLDVYLSDEDVFQPDIVFISNERLDIIQAEGLHGAPDLVIEVLSPSTERIDRTLKHERYEMFDVKEYWRAEPGHQDNHRLSSTQRRIRAYRRIRRRHDHRDAAAARAAR